MTPLTASKEKAKGKVPAIRLPTGNWVSIGVYVTAWKRIKQLEPEYLVRGFNDWDETAAHILSRISDAVNDRINIRGCIRTDWPELNQDRLYRKLAKAVVCTCRWCGTTLDHYEPANSRFCSLDCRRCYWF